MARCIATPIAGRAAGIWFPQFNDEKPHELRVLKCALWSAAVLRRAGLVVLKPSGRDWFEWIWFGTSFGDGSAFTKALFQLSFAYEASSRVAWAVAL
jgi:hypothetical protein